MTDRCYQERTLDAIRQKISVGYKKILCVLPTGGGKGYLAARVQQMAAEKGNDTIFFADQRELVTQVSRQLERLNVPCNTIMRGVEDEYESTEHWEASRLCSVVAKDTLWSRAFRSTKIALPSASLIQVDEAHKSMSRTYQKIMKAYADSIVIGWTATPCRADGRDLGAFYETMIQAATYTELQQLGFLVPIRVFAPERPDLRKLGRTGADFQRGQLEERMNKDGMVGSIVGEWVKNSEGRKTVLFASGIRHSIHCRDEFRKIGIRAEHIDGTMEQKERDDLMHEALAGNIDVLCNYGVLHTGVDVPAWKYMICARPTKSFGLWRQMAGRIQRPYPGHDHAVIQDHSDNTFAFGFPDEDVEWTLGSDEKIQDLHARKRKEKKKPEFHCPKCATVYRGPVCTKCGTKPVMRGKAVDMGKGQLSELKRTKAKRKKKKKDANPTETKNRYWKECLGWAIGQNKKIGAAAHRYRERFGVWPGSQIQDVPRGKDEWNMTGREFYEQVLKPKKVASQ